MQSRGTATVTADLRVRLDVPGDVPVPLPVRLHYRTDEPFSVRAEFLTGDAGSVEWVFARDLLSDGLTQPAGDGDVRVWPVAGAGTPVVSIALTSPDGHARLEADATVISAFIERTAALVPPGTEPSYLDLDNELDALLRRSA
ncbi:MAG: SsgA family sporulation/cell division regulator [Motilibacteraceae bacterium]